jgi:TetR/AcrR family tetracycline transcriptional repressor
MTQRPAQTETAHARSWGYGELTRDDVVAAGLRLTRQSGFAKLSMRSLAAELGSPSMIAYYYISDKQHLLDLVGDAVLGEIVFPPAELPWERRLTLLFEDGRDVLLRYPGVAQHLLRRVEGLPNETRLYRGITEILSTAGFDREVSDRTQRVFAYLLFGAVTSELATVAAAGALDAMTFCDDEEVFRFGLGLLVDGLRPLRKNENAPAHDEDVGFGAE